MHTSVANRHAFCSWKGSKTVFSWGPTEGVYDAPPDPGWGHSLPIPPQHLRLLDLCNLSTLLLTPAIQILAMPVHATHLLSKNMGTPLYLYGLLNKICVLQTDDSIVPRD